jgi:UDP-N-acetylglucosamine diphosphorylase / glucose-1-phosphate thymidylyltransferase / UDP-N-acetylgalactosamine diphosphorylase / glucosamine-1-phosphate N-acetyltransferase / galactosamine-1-phosphate N-acetyltransferase
LATCAILANTLSMPSLKISDLIADTPDFLANLAPWVATQAAPDLVARQVAEAGAGFCKENGNAIHETAQVEEGAVLKGPIYLGPDTMVAHGAYLRGGVWLERDAIIGPNCEVKTCFMFAGSKLAHLSFAGDSVLGRGVNVEAGAMLANYRNEKLDKMITFLFRGERITTGVDKFGCLLGDNCRVGANAVVAPGAVFEPGSIIKRLQLVDLS